MRRAAGLDVDFVSPALAVTLARVWLPARSLPHACPMPAQDDDDGHRSFKLFLGFLVLVAGVAVALLIFTFMRAAETRAFRDNFDYLCKERASVIDQQLHYSSTVLRGFIGLEADPFVTADNFAQYANFSVAQDTLDTVRVSSAPSSAINPAVAMRLTHPMRCAACVFALLRS